MLISALSQFLSGGTMVALLGIGVYFFKFWKQSRDRFFACFGISFMLMALAQVMVLIVGPLSDALPYAYGIRLLAFVMIIFAIVEKNMPSRQMKQK